MSDEKREEAVRLVDPGVPADQGLASLGLLMQLTGSVFAAYAALAAFTMIFAMRGLGRGGGETGWLMLILGVTVARSLYHRAAGTELLYGGTNPNRLTGVKRYLVIALGHSALLAAILVGKFELPTTFGIAVGAGLATWPVALAVLLQLPRFRRFATEMPVGEDKGFESASILMTVLGTCGVLATGAILLAMLDAGEALISQGPGVLMLVATVLLVIRSGMHVQAGLSGLRETSVERSVERANRYANFGVISSFCAAGAVLLMSMMGGLNIVMLAVVAGLCWMLMAWPLIIRRFYSERQFEDLMAGDNAAVHRRAPDAGLTGLGWLLFAHAIFGASFVIPQLIVGPEFLENRLTQSMAFLSSTGSRSVWWSVGLAVLQGWAGFELLRMSIHHRVIATAYAVVAGALTVYMTLPLLEALKDLSQLGPTGMLVFIPLAIQLVIPVATLILVNRNIAPTATARFRPRPVAPPSA